MSKPVLLTVDDDPEVLRSIERDLRRRFADRYRVMRADSGKVALDTLHQLKTRNNPVALLLADDRRRLSSPGDGDLSGCEARSAHGVCRYGCRDSRHKPGQDPSLSAEALGSAGAGTLSGCGRSAGRLAGEFPSSVRRRARVGQPLVPALV